MIEKFDSQKHNPDAVKKLLAMALGHPTPERLHKILDVFYANKGRILFIATDKDRIIGIIGYDITATPHGWIVQLAVHPDYRMRGIGKSLIEQTMSILELESAALTTDQDSVNFYRACGFNDMEIYSPWPGTRRYRCTKGQMPETVLEYYDKLTVP
jgi:ribosomal protein S18 acetylase RimI-like enzyme